MNNQQSPITLRLIGTGSMYAHPERSCSATLVDTGKTRILIDAGPGTWRRLAEFRISVHDIDYLFITHFHPDHISDLVPILFDRYLTGETGSDKTLFVRGPSGLLRFIELQYQAYGRWLADPRSHVDFAELSGERFDVGTGSVTWRKMLHSDESLGYRFEFDGKSLCFSGDTGDCPAVVELCRAADIAVIECAHADGRSVQNHLTPRTVANIARRAGLRKLVLNHFYADVLAEDIAGIIAQNFSGEIIVGWDGEQILV